MKINIFMKKIFFKNIIDTTKEKPTTEIVPSSKGCNLCEMISYSKGYNFIEMIF